MASFQRDHDLPAIGRAGPLTLAAIETAHAALPPPVARLDDLLHPDNLLFKQAQSAVFQLDADHGRLPDQRSDNLAAALTVAARREGLMCIDRLLLSERADNVIAVQNHTGYFLDRYAGVPTVEALNTPIERSSQQWQQLPPPLEQAFPQQTQEAPVSTVQHVRGPVM